MQATTYPPFRYRLDPGERFTIRGVAERAVHLLPVAGPRVCLQTLEIGFLLDCEVTDQPSENLCRIESLLREVTVFGQLFGRSVEVRSDRSVFGGPVGKRHMDEFAQAIGDRFVVTKSLFGPISHVEGGDLTKNVLGGVSVAEGLSWYGASFPDRALTHGEEWSDALTLSVSPKFLGLPGTQAHPIQVGCVYRAAGWETFQDLTCPLVRQVLDFRGISSLGPLELESKGSGEGLVLPNLRDGKIARSKKRARIRTRISPRGLKVPLGHFEVTLATDSWHQA